VGECEGWLVDGVRLGAPVVGFLVGCGVGRRDGCFVVGAVGLDASDRAPASPSTPASAPCARLGARAATAAKSTTNAARRYESARILLTGASAGASVGSESTRRFLKNDTACTG